MTDNPVLLALDVPTAEEAVRLAEDVRAYVGGFKVGLGLLMGPGPGVIGALEPLSLPVLADAKLHDIPSTVETAARRLGELGARWVTVHATGGREMLVRAVSGLREGSAGRASGVLAVTVLTSLNDAALAEAGWPGGAARLTARTARLAARSGCEGVICSPRELTIVRDVAPGLLRVTPGIRLPEAERHDQERVATPQEALEYGADLIVVGRAITRASDPVRAAAALAEALGNRERSPEIP